MLAILNNLNDDNNAESKSFNPISEFENLYQLSESNALIIVDATCRIIYSNSSFRKAFKYYHYQKFFDLNSEPDLRNTIQLLANSNYNNMQFDLYYSPEHNLDNNDFNVQAERIIINEVEYIVLVFKSFNEKTKLEAKINDLHNALEYGRVPIIITNDSGIITYSTTSFEKILNKAIEVIYNQSVVDVLSFYLTNEEKKNIELSISRVEVWTKIISSMDESGNTLYEELKLNPVYLEGNENLNFILTANDITNYILKNLFIKKSERRLKSIINNISDLLFIFKRKEDQLLFENANENFCNIFSINKINSFKKSLHSVLDKNLYSQIFTAISKIEVSHDPNVSFNFINSNKRQYSVKISFIYDEIEKESIFIVAMQDITDQMLYEEQLKKAYETEISLNKMKTAFLENMSHEIRTPFNAIVGYSEIIDEYIQSKEYNSLIDLIGSFKDVLTRVLNLFNNIVEVSQIYSGEIEFDLVTLNCNQVIQSIFNNKLSEAQKKNLDLILNLGLEDLNIKIDWIKFEKILESLVDNAIKYTDQGTISISTEEKGNEVQIIISDTGRGIEEQDLKKLIQPFVQAEDAYIRNYEGAGLGLTIAYQLTKLMQGEFFIESKKDNGTKVILSFPKISKIS